MPVGGWYVDKRELDEFEDALRDTAGHIKDITKVYGEIGRKAGRYVMTHEPIYAGSKKDSSSHPPPGYMQSKTKGGGGKAGAYVAIRGVDYLYMQEFGGSSFWHRGAAGSLRKANKAHKSYANMGAKGHIIYKKPRKSSGYFIWNVAFRLRSYIGQRLTQGIADIGNKYGIAIDITDTNLEIEEEPKP